MSTIATISRSAEAGAPMATTGGEFRATLEQAASRLAMMMIRYRTRRALLRLSDAQLKDIGVTRVDAFREGLKPFWD